MPCSLKPHGVGWSAATGSSITIKVVADNTTITAATYNNASVPVAANTITFTVVSGAKLLDLALVGPDELVKIVEVCSDGSTQLLDQFNVYQPTEGITIWGQP
jgi:hypothetical protein